MPVNGWRSKCCKCWCTTAYIATYETENYFERRETCASCRNSFVDAIQFVDTCTNPRSRNFAVSTRLSSIDVGQLFGGTVILPGQADRLSKAAQTMAVYFLYRHHKLVYIGQSVSVWSRLRAHFRECLDGRRMRDDATSSCKCDFATVCTMPSRDVMDSVETILIWLLRPRRNGLIKKPTTDDFCMASQWFSRRRLDLTPLIRSLCAEPQQQEAVA